MTDDAIVEGIKAICAPMPECRELRDRILAELAPRLADATRLREVLAVVARDSLASDGWEMIEAAERRS